MKAFVHEGVAGLSGAHYTVDFKSPPSPGSGEVKVNLKAAGLNHRDLFVVTRHQQDQPPLILGSDGAGIVSEVGPQTKTFRVGDEVLIIPSLRWERKTAAPPDDFEILGLPDNGTFAEQIVLPEAQLARKPDYLSWTEAGVLPLSALTGYRALFTKGELKSGQTVFIPGIGSGVATYMLQMAKAVGALVVVSSRSTEKLARAKVLGADLLLKNDEDWETAMEGNKVDLVIESVGAATFNRSLSLLKKGGTVIAFGASAGDEVALNLRTFFYNQWQLRGTTMGSIDEFHEMLKLFQSHEIRPVVDHTFELAETADALHYLLRSGQFGKVAIHIQ
ncbi:zinc-binding dehydrogenase [Sporolactobacillus sp. CPB3-1]|uniref:Zinc-binding dehydrogenase n=1 Tax=Sporolactobacillus mangiferae TaxID=2940498 RepID=A0ABT0MAX9_9BACL|nr:zinc-binding dehydrogenase [Sporolactobacillus mangiferae]MCL1632026.1 zinc-binding dehydrogenase [Sporolactobacillus mangiferae]